MPSNWKHNWTLSAISGLIDVDAHDVPHRSAAAAVARHDQAQRAIGERGAIHPVGNLYGPAGELRGDLGKRDGGGVPVGAGDPDDEVYLLGGLRRIVISSSI
jgi:hypothetical protein